METPGPPRKAVGLGLQAALGMSAAFRIRPDGSKGRSASPEMLDAGAGFEQARRHFAACADRQLCHNFVAGRPLGSRPMSIDSHLSELVRRHQAIEEAILAEENHPASDDIKVHELKRKKLQLKDEIERLKHQAETAPSH